MMELLLCLILCVAPAIAESCQPGHIPLVKGSVMATSHDSYYEAGDIFNRNCSAMPKRKYVGWCPSPHDNKPKLQVNLPGNIAVHGLVFQSTLAACPMPNHNFGMEAYLETFDLQYVLPGDNTRTLMSYGEDLPALDGTSAQKTLKFDPPLVTPILTFTPKSHNIYPCFRFAVIGCKAESLCPTGFCLNGGKCAGENFCTCARGFAGDRCNMTAKDIEQQDYSFMAISNNKLTTPYAEFDVVGDVTLSENRRRDSHHHHGHSCHFHSHHGHHSYCQYSHSNHHNSHSYNHGHGHSSNNHCMHGLTNNHHGFTTSMHVNFGHNHHGHHYIYSNGGNLHGHHGCSLSYNTITKLINFVVSTVTHKWSVNLHIDLGKQQTNHISTSWHPHTGAHVSVNNQHVGSCGHPKPHSTQHTSSVPLRLGNGHVSTNSQINVNVNVNMNMSISGLNMFPAPQSSLTNVGVNGPFTPAPLTTTPATTSTTTTAQVSATTTHSPPPTPKQAHVNFTPPPATTTLPPTTTVDHRPVCYTYSNVATTGTVQTHTRCQSGEVCALFEDQKGYTAKCLEKSLCEAGKNLAAGKCWECCDKYLCNDHCSASSSGPCSDKPQCAVMLSTGYDVCSDTKMAVDICSKTCKIC